MVNILKLITVTATADGYELSPFVLVREFNETEPPSKYVNWRNVPVWLQYSPGNPVTDPRPRSFQQTLADYKSLPRLKLADGIYTFDATCEFVQNRTLIVSVSIRDIVMSIKPDATNILQGVLWTMIPEASGDDKQTRKKGFNL